MKKIVYFAVLVLMFVGIPTFAAPHGGHRPPMHGGVSTVHRPPVHRGPSFHVSVGRPLPPPIYRPYRPIVRPYPMYYYSPYTTYSYTYYYEPTVTEVPVSQTVVVKENNYAGVNTAANIINAAANVATAIRVLSW